MTTMIIDREEGVILSDSRGTEYTDVHGWRILPYPHRFTKTEKTFHKVKKVFEINNHVVSGSGSLFVLEHFVRLLKSGKYCYKDRYLVKSEFDLGYSDSYTTKKSCGKIHTLRLKINTKPLLFGYQLLKLKKSVVKARYAVSGSGSSFAAGALEAGASMAEALDIAAKLDEYTDKEKQWIILGETNESKTSG